jgi:tetratricopeptide (TPR) repeat protein
MDSLLELEKLGLQLTSAGATNPEFTGKTYTALYELGHSYFEARDLEKAKTVFQALIRAFPFSLEAILALGSTCYLQKDYELALKAFRIYQTLSPKDHLGYLYEAYIWIDLDRRADAVFLLEKTLVLIDTGSKLEGEIKLMISQLKLDGTYAKS